MRLFIVILGLIFSSIPCSLYGQVQSFDIAISLEHDGMTPRDVVAGLRSDATDGFDLFLDKVVPPDPPGDPFYGYISHPPYGPYHEDYRAYTTSPTEYVVYFRNVESGSITLTWDNSAFGNHTVQLLNAFPSQTTLNLDMSTTTSYTIANNSDLAQGLKVYIDLDDGGGGSGPFQESGGQVVMEAENFDTNITRSNLTWALQTDEASYSGSGAMAVIDTSEPNYSSGYTTTSPELTYEVDFSTSGTYYVWLRVRAYDSGSNRVHAGIGGSGQSSHMRELDYSGWMWTNERVSGSTATLSVGSAGQETINIWLQKDEIYVDKIVLTTDANYVPQGQGPAESSRGGGGGNQAPTAVASASPSSGSAPLVVAFSSAGSSDPDGSISSYSWSFGDGGSSTSANPSYTYVAAGTYTATLTVTDNQGATGSDQVNVSVSGGGGGSGPFQESGGQVVMEAENFDTNITRSNLTWALQTDEASYSGSGAMAVIDTSEPNYSSGYTTTSPELTYEVDFSTSGTYYVWLRVRAYDSGSNRVHAGIGGSGQSSHMRELDYSGWMWTNERVSGSTATLSVGSAGQETINIWLQKDEIYVDKIVLTTDANYVPQGQGPAESSRGGGGGNQAPTAVASASPSSGSAPLVVAFSSAGSSDPDGSISSYSWSFAKGGSSTSANPSYTYVAAGTYTATLTVTDNQGATGSDQVNVSVSGGGGGSGPFQESGGQVVMEAENFDTNITRSNLTWALQTDEASYSGSGAMAVIDTSEPNYSSGYTTTSPELTYEVDFSTSGTYYVWLRVRAYDSGSNRVHAGIGGSGQSSHMRELDYSGWMWTNERLSGSSGTISVGSSGQETINIWLQKDEIYVDKIVLTTDANYVPQGQGPAESSRGSSSLNQVVSLSSGEEPFSLPTRFEAAGNFPNPVRSQTTLVLEVPTDGHADLTLYDLSGRALQNMRAIPISAGYEQPIEVDLSGYPAGVYIYRVILHDVAGALHQAAGQLVRIK